ncbi:CobW-like GTP-binding protein [Streptomyces thinghirensis]|nr:CobW-like GTP-binding protein [Streptomyces thinghirensis]
MSGPDHPGHSDHRGRPDDPGRPALPVVIVGGLHADARRAAGPGAGRRARQRRPPPRPGDGYRGTVVRTVRDATGILSAGEAPLVNDCACCALREDLVPELERLADAGGTPLAVVELWDSVEPKAMAEVVTAGGFTVTGVITAVDPALVLPYPATATTSPRAASPPRPPTSAPSPTPSRAS